MTTDHPPAPLYAGIVVEAPLTTVFHYRVPPALAGDIRPGDRAAITFARRRTRGVVVSLTGLPPIKPELIRDLDGISPPEERVPEDLLSLTKWVAEYYRSSWGTVLAAAIPGAVKQGRRERRVKRVELVPSPEEAAMQAVVLDKRAPKQANALRRIAKFFAEHPDETLPADHPNIKDDAPAAMLRSLAERGLIRMEETVAAAETSYEAPAPEITLSPEQAAAVGAMTSGLESGGFCSYLLHGITGSGKTEVYIRMIDQVLRAGRGALVLVPEISLTPQTVSRFTRRFGRIAVLHSNLGEGERASHWRSLCSGEVKLAVGARSAVFAPVQNLGLVVVDEEHERSYKQDNDPRYNARDVAIMRAHRAGAMVILGSATPSLESWRNADLGKHTLLPMPSRPGGAEPPRVEVVDLRQEWADVKKPTLFSRRLEQALTDCLKRREQAILFLNRRGFHTSVRCGACGEALECPNCDVAMTHHRAARILRCGCCGYDQGVPDRCPTCGAQNLKFLGTGVERVEDVLGAMFPNARLLRMDSDSMTHRDAHRTSLAAFGKGEYDILLGTQMVAKGLDFPNVTLVGVLMADGALGMSDFRAAERTFQLVTQVIGRAGRAGKAGLAVVQAFQPEHPAVACAVAQDYHAFVEGEMPDRRKRGYPPFGRLTRVLVTGEREDAVRDAADDAGRLVRKTLPDGCRLLGPVPCEVERLESVYRRHMLLFAPDTRVMAEWLQRSGLKPGVERGVRFILDTDPLSML
ncbi:MAG: primosomal protein N' [Planctomycetaceae bacterium]|nr:primosomal protein N' [Planctomycetaceae bacterium]